MRCAKCGGQLAFSDTLEPFPLVLVSDAAGHSYIIPIDRFFGGRPDGPR